MRKTARGRIVPQSRSTDPRIGRVSLKAAILYDRMWINADDQGRLSGDPDEIKYIVCPNLPEISKEDVPSLLKELADIKPGLILLYPTSKTEAIQMIDWWEEQKLQWASPSSNLPPEGWTDHVRYHLTPKEIITENWPPAVLPSVLPSTLLKSPLTTPSDKDKEEEAEEEEEEEEGRVASTLASVLPSVLASTAAPSLTGSPLLEYLILVFPAAFGKKPNSRETAQLRDLGKEISSAGGAAAQQVYEAYKEACSQNKLSVSYVRAILLDWLGVERNRY